MRVLFLQVSFNAGMNSVLVLLCLLAASAQVVAGATGTATPMEGSTTHLQCHADTFSFVCMWHDSFLSAALLASALHHLCEELLRVTI